MNKKVLSYSFFRNDESGYEHPNAGFYQGIFFSTYIAPTVRANRQLYPTWEIWVHHDDRVREFPCFAMMEKMHTRGVIRLVPCGVAEELCEAMLWRMKPVWDDEVDVVLCRDLDALTTPREVEAVHRWLASGSPFHGITDNPAHTPQMLMGGMVGFRCDEVRSWLPSYESFISSIRKHRIDLSRHGADQKGLNAMFRGRSAMIRFDDTDSLGPRKDARDLLATGMGVPFSVDEAVAYYDEHHPDPAIQECEAKP